MLVSLYNGLNYKEIDQVYVHKMFRSYQMILFMEIIAFFQKFYFYGYCLFFCLDLIWRIFLEVLLWIEYYLSLSLSLSLSIYIYICVCVYLYIYIKTIRKTNIYWNIYMKLCPFVKVLTLLSYVIFFYLTLLKYQLGVDRGYIPVILQ